MKAPSATRPATTPSCPASFQTNYIAYVKTGSIANADFTRAYLSLVPFEEGTADYATLKAHARIDDTYLNGPDSPVEHQLPLLPPGPRLGLRLASCATGSGTRSSP